MTFLEAAIEILRRADGALHFRDIAKKAVDDNLLSHVGRDPEAAMRSCLNSASRTEANGAPAVILRARPGYFRLGPGAPAAPAPRGDIQVTARPEPRTSPKPASEPAGMTEASESEGEDDTLDDSEEESREGARHRKRRTRVAKTPSVPPVAAPTSMPKVAASRAPEARIEFEAPTGSGLEGVTDVELVMANAMSRLVEGRPELRTELEAMQTRTPMPLTPPPQASGSAASSGGGQTSRSLDSRSDHRSADHRPTDHRSHAEAQDDRPGRRRRRRRRRGRRVDWAAQGADTKGSAANLTERLLEGVTQVLQDAGSRSLHVRQIAEHLAGKGILGGEISEIERAVTGAVLLDIHTHGRASRFVARGDARYQLYATRLPEALAKAEQATREAVRRLEQETREQLVQWLRSLGARALESLVRMYLQREGYALVSALPPARGLGKLVVEDPEGDDEDARLVVFVIPKRSANELRALESEGERNGGSGAIAFVMGELPEDAGLADARIIGAPELAEWMREQGIGVARMRFEVSVLDPAVIESIGGLDT